jgi:hypothetical protein
MKGITMALVVKQTKKMKKIVVCDGCGADTQNLSHLCDNCDTPDIFNAADAMDDGTGWAIINNEEEVNEDQEDQE